MYRSHFRNRDSPVLFVWAIILDYEQKLFLLPAKKGGLGVRTPQETSDTAKRTLQAATQRLVEAVKYGQNTKRKEHGKN